MLARIANILKDGFMWPPIYLNEEHEGIIMFILTFNQLHLKLLYVSKVPMMKKYFWKKYRNSVSLYLPPELTFISLSFTAYCFWIHTVNKSHINHALI